MDIDNISIEADEDLIFVTVSKYKLFLSHDKIGMDAYLLYSHLMFTARIQKTNRIYAKDPYIKKGLNWGAERLAAAKSLLLELKLIEVDQERKKGKFGKTYITVKTKKSPFEKYKKPTVTPETGTPQNRLRFTDNKCLNKKDKYLNKKERRRDFDKSLNQPSEIKINECTEYWNKLSHTRKHRESSTKVHQKINKYIEQLMKGTFTDHNIIDEKFIERNKIPKKLLSKKWTESQIKRILKRVNLLYVEGYWPYDKSKLVKGLDSIIYNPQTGTSYFLMCAMSPPRLLSEKKEKKVLINNEKIYYKYKGILNPANDQGFKYAFKDFETKVENVLKDVRKLYSHTSFKSYFGTVEKFCDKHITWLKEQNKMFPGLLKGQPWEHFKDWVYKNYNFLLEPNQKQRERIERDRIESERRHRQYQDG